MHIKNNALEIAGFGNNAGIRQTTYSNCSDGEIRLAGEVTATSGRLEICYNHAWGTICNYQWEDSDSNVACRQLGFHSYGEIC